MFENVNFFIKISGSATLLLAIIFQPQWKSFLHIRPDIRCIPPVIVADTDPDPGSKKFRYGSGSSPKDDTDPGKTIRIQAQKIQYQENLKNLLKYAHVSCFVCLFILQYLTKVKNSYLFSVFHGFCWIRIRIICYESGFRIQLNFDTDPDSGSS